MSSPPICGFGRTSAPADRRLPIFDNVGDMVALVAAAAKSRPSLSAMTGAPVAWRGDVPPGCLHQGRWPQRSTAVPRPRLPLETLKNNGITNFRNISTTRCGSRTRARRRRDDADRVGRTRVLGSVRAPVYPEGQGLPCRCRPPSAVAGLADRADIATFAESTGSPAFAAG